MGKGTFNKSLLLFGLIGTLSISAFFHSAADSFDRNASHYNINYNDSSYDSKYILSPVSTGELDSTQGNNYYIIVAAYETTSSIDNTSLTIANALFDHPRTKSTITGHSFRFKFVDDETKTIDIRDLGADVGGAIFAYIHESITHQEEVMSSLVEVEETYDCLFSMANLQYVKASNISDSAGFSFTNDVQDATSWDVTSDTDDGQVNCFNFMDINTSCYINLDNAEFEFNQSGSNRQLYFYSISESLARELSWSVCAHYMYWTNDKNPGFFSQDDLSNLYCELPYFERELFRRRAWNTSTTYSSGTMYDDFNQAASLGVKFYDDSFTDYDCYKGPSVDASTLTINYSLGYITGFSPFEYFISVCTDDSRQTAIEECASVADEAGYTSYRIAIEKDTTVDYRCTEYYKKSRLYLIEPGSTSDFSFYGETIYLKYGKLDDSTTSEYGSKTDETLTIAENPAAGINLTLKIATKNDLNGDPVQCIFDEEVQLTYTGDGGDHEYEYALVSGSLFYNWSQYNMSANLEKMTWQSSPIFNFYLTYDGMMPIGEENDMVGFIRMAGDIPSPVIAFIENIMPANYDEGYKKRMQLLNDTLYSEYTEEHADVYDTLGSDSLFETFSLGALYEEADTVISDITDRDIAKESNSLANQDKLAMAYEVTFHIHERIASDLMDAYSENQTTRSANINEQLMNSLVSYTVDLTSDAETEIGIIDDLIDAALAQIEASTSIDNLCKQFINAFNNALAEHPEYRSELWEMFHDAIDSIYNAASLEDAEEAYNAAIAQITQIVSGESNGGD